MTGWGPFRSGLPDDERKAQLRSLRMALRLLLGERGRAAGFAVLRVEVQGADPDLVAEALDAFERLDPLDRRRVLATFSEVTFAKAG